MRKLSAVPAVAILLSGCGGGGGGTAALPAPPNGSPRLPTVSDAITFKIPSSVSSSARRGAYVPANAGSVRISVTAVNGAPPNPAVPDVIAALNPSAAGCSNATGSLVCTVNAILPVATVTLTISIYASADGSGTPLATNTKTVTVGGTGTNSIGFTLGGVPSSMSLGAPIVTAADGTTKTIALPVSVMDASGATIIAPGTYSQPVMLAISGDTNTALSLSSTQVAGPSTTVNLIYDSSKALTSATITATATGSTGATTQVNPLVYQPNTLAAMVINGSPTTVIVSEAGYGGAFTVGLASPLTSISCSPVNCTPASVGGQVALTVQPSTVAGSATATITDANSVVANLPIGFASAGGIIGVPGIPTFLADPLTGGAIHPSSPVAGSDGRIWYAEISGTTRQPAAMNPNTGVETQYAVAAFTGAASVNISGAALGPDGNIWYTDAANGQVDVVTPAGAISVNGTTSAVSVPDTIAEGADGNMWIGGTATGVPVIVKVEPNPFSMSAYSGLSGTPTSIIGAPDGNVWFTESKTIGRITPAGTITEFSTGITGTINPGLAIGADGCLWFTENSPNTVAKLRLSSGIITEYTTGITATPGGIAQGGDGNLWFAEPSSSSVARVTTNGVVSEYFAGAGHVPNAMVLAPNGELWFTETTKNTLGWLTY